LRIKLTDRSLLAMKPGADRYHVGDSVVRGLRVRVSSDGARVFSVVYRSPSGTVRTYTIGAYPEVSLAAARDTARDVKAGARLGTDRQEEKIKTRQAARSAVDFAGLAGKFLAARKELAKSTRTEYERMVARYVGSAPVGKIAARAVTRRDLRDLLEGIASEAPVMANRVFQLVRAVCRWAVRDELLIADPSAGLERPRREASRERTLTDPEAAVLVRSLSEHTLGGVKVPAVRADVAAVVQVLLLEGQRSSETAEMRWSDLDLDGPIPAWTIPGQFRKGGRLHVVPLSPAVVRILKALPRKGERVFAGVREANAERDWWGAVRQRAEALYKKTHEAELPRFGKHDLRRTCATGCAKLGAAPWIVSRILGHAIPQGTVAVSGVYNRYAGLAEMASALNAWGSHVERIAVGEAPGKVLPMRAGRA